MATDRYRRLREPPREAWGSGRPAMVASEEEGSPRLPSISKAMNAFSISASSEAGALSMERSAGSLPSPRSPASCSPSRARKLHATTGARGVRASSPELIRAEGAARNLRYQLAAVQNKHQLDLAAAAEEIASLRRDVTALKEQTERQRGTIKELERALAEYQRIDHLQARTMTRSTHQLDQEIRVLKNKLRDSQDTSRADLTAAMELSKRAMMERNALATALAYIAQQALGGDAATTDDVQGDLEACVNEGGEVLPRSTRIWLGLTYELDEQGNLVSPSKAAGAAPATGAGLSSVLAAGGGKGRGGLGLSPKLLDRDGSRAVASLAQQISRLWKQRGAYRHKYRQSLEAVRQLQSVLDEADQDFVMFHLMVDRIKAEAVRLGDCLGLTSVAMMVPELQGDMSGHSARRVSERCDVVQAVVQSLVEELLMVREQLRCVSSREGASASSSQQMNMHAVHRDMVEAYRFELSNVYGSPDFLSRAALTELLEGEAPSPGRRRRRGGSPARSPKRSDASAPVPANAVLSPPPVPVAGTTAAAVSHAAPAPVTVAAATASDACPHVPAPVATVPESSVALATCEVLSPRQPTAAKPDGPSSGRPSPRLRSPMPSSLCEDSAAAARQDSVHAEAPATRSPLSGGSALQPGGMRAAPVTAPEQGEGSVVGSTADVPPEKPSTPCRPESRSGGERGTGVDAEGWEGQLEGPEAPEGPQGPEGPEGPEGLEVEEDREIGAEEVVAEVSAGASQGMEEEEEEDVGGVEGEEGEPAVEERAAEQGGLGEDEEAGEGDEGSAGELVEGEAAWDEAAAEGTAVLGEQEGKVGAEAAVDAGCMDENHAVLTAAGGVVTAEEEEAAGVQQAGDGEAAGGDAPDLQQGGAEEGAVKEEEGEGGDVVQREAAAGGDEEAEQGVLGVDGAEEGQELVAVGADEVQAPELESATEEGEAATAQQGAAGEETMGEEEVTGEKEAMGKEEAGSTDLVPAVMDGQGQGEMAADDGAAASGAEELLVVVEGVAAHDDAVGAEEDALVAADGGAEKDVRTAAAGGAEEQEGPAGPVQELPSAEDEGVAPRTVSMGDEVEEVEEAERDGGGPGGDLQACKGGAAEEVFDLGHVGEEERAAGIDGEEGASKEEGVEGVAIEASVGEEEVAEAALGAGAATPPSVDGAEGQAEAEVASMAATEAEGEAEGVISSSVNQGSDTTVQDTAAELQREAEAAEGADEGAARLAAEAAAGEEAELAGEPSGAEATHAAVGGELGTEEEVFEEAAGERVTPAGEAPIPQGLVEEAPVGEAPSTEELLGEAPGEGETQAAFEEQPGAEDAAATEVSGEEAAEEVARVAEAVMLSDSRVAQEGVAVPTNTAEGLEDEYREQASVCLRSAEKEGEEGEAEAAGRVSEAGVAGRGVEELEEGARLEGALPVGGGVVGQRELAPGVEEGAVVETPKAEMGDEDEAVGSRTLDERSGWESRQGAGEGGAGVVEGAGNDTAVETESGGMRDAQVLVGEGEVVQGNEQGGMDNAPALGNEAERLEGVGAAEESSGPAVGDADMGEGAGADLGGGMAGAMEAGMEDGGAAQVAGGGAKVGAAILVADEEGAGQPQGSEGTVADPSGLGLHADEGAENASAGDVAGEVGAQGGAVGVEGVEGMEQQGGGEGAVLEQAEASGADVTGASNDEVTGDIPQQQDGVGGAVEGLQQEANEQVAVGVDSGEEEEAVALPGTAEASGAPGQAGEEADHEAGQAGAEAADLSDASPAHASNASEPAGMNAEGSAAGAEAADLPQVLEANREPAEQPEQAVQAAGGEGNDPPGVAEASGAAQGIEEADRAAALVAAEAAVDTPEASEASSLPEPDQEPGMAAGADASGPAAPEATRRDTGEDADLPAVPEVAGAGQEQE